MKLASLRVLPVMKGSRGVVSTYSSSIPPGSAWLYLPGVLVFSDYRLFELCGSLPLHLGTLIGLFTLVQLAFSRSAARIAVLLYAFSPIGLFFASTLWPRGHPFFVCWFVVWIVLWHSRKDAKYLAAALVTFAAGMYVFMELAPLALVPIAVHYLCRPPLRTKWVLAAALISLLIWSPYLRFEQTRGFRDIASLLFQVDIMPRDHGRLLCDTSLREEVLKQAPAEKSILMRARSFVRGRPRAALIGLFSNFGLHRQDLVALLRSFVRQVTPAGGLLVAILALFVAVAAVRHLPRLVSLRSPLLTDAQKIVVLSLALPWIVLVLVAEGLDRRYLFLWPLQTALLAYFLTDLLARWTKRAWIRAAQAALIVIVGVNPVVDTTVLARLEDWRTNGWAGTDSDIYSAVGFVAERVYREGRTQAAIGYSIAVCTDPAYWQSCREGGDDAYHAIDPRYKVGLGMDYVLNQRFGIGNSDWCPEGISSADDYVIAKLGPDFDPPECVGLRRRILSEFRQIGQFGEYVVLAR